MSRKAVALALLAAALFGLSTPAAKLLLAGAGPWTLAGILYIGAGLGLGLLRLALPSRQAREAGLTWHELPWLAAAIAAGGVIGPVLLMVGLQHMAASSASLLLTLEGVFTALLAWFAFGENFDRRIALGMALIVLGALVLNWHGEVQLAGLIGPLAIAGACLAWALDNNLTRAVSLSDPLQIAMLKGAIAGPISLAIGLLSGETLPPPWQMAAGAVVGWLGYGISLTAFVMALRDLGTARTGAYFATAPFLGAILAVPLLGEAASWQLVAAGATMAAGVWLHLTERHEHEHQHEALEHEHRHRHDDLHHAHGHDGPLAPDTEHSHRHVHTRLRHRHRHVPDAHHRHSH